MKIKTSEAKPIQINWLVAKCEGYALHKDAMLAGEIKRGWWISKFNTAPNVWAPLSSFNPSKDPAHSYSIIFRERILVQPEIGKEGCDNAWSAISMHGTEAYGPTPLIAAMRTYIASKIGAEVNIPDDDDLRDLQPRDSLIEDAPTMGTSRPGQGA